MKLVNLILLSLSSYGRLLIPLICLVNLRWTFSIIEVYFFNLLFQILLPYSKIGLTKVLKSGTRILNISGVRVFVCLIVGVFVCACACILALCVLVFCVCLCVGVYAYMCICEHVCTCRVHIKCVG